MSKVKELPTGLSMLATSDGLILVKGRERIVLTAGEMRHIEEYFHREMLPRIGDSFFSPDNAASQEDAT